MHALLGLLDGTDPYIAAIYGETSFISSTTNNSAAEYEPPVGVARNVTLDLSGLVTTQRRAVVVSDVVGLRTANVLNRTVTSDGKLTVYMEPFGGFFAKLTTE